MYNGTEAVSARVNHVGRAAMDAAFAVHRALGPGRVESVYGVCLTEELRQAGLAVERQVGIPVAYGEVRLDVGYRLDLPANKSLVVEVKSIDVLASIPAAQLLTCLRFSGLRLGYLINFNTVRLKDGFRRSVP
jgi:GxxExxY protein